VGLVLNAIYQGDCLDRFNEVESASVDLVFADPPFNIGYEYDVYDDRRSRHEYQDWCRRWMSAVFRVLKPDGTFWLAIGDEFAAELKLIAQDDLGFFCRSWVIWYYTFGVNCARGFSRSHTHLFHFVKDPKNFTFNRLNPAVRILSARQLVYADRRANSEGRLPDNTWIIRPQDAPRDSLAPMHDTWYFARIAGTFKEREGFHGCQMPEQLLGRIIRISSRPCDVVLDPFAGSGTTLVVAKKLSRQWLGFELSHDYVARIQQRLEGARVGGPLDGPADPIKSAPATKEGKSKVTTKKGRVVPQADKETQWGIIEAFRNTCQGQSADVVLCEPDLNSEFVKECKKMRLAGDAYTWNRLLLRIRKSGKLPKLGENRNRLTIQDLDHYSCASEIAMQLLSIDFRCTLDDLLCHPALAGEFDQMARNFAPGHSAYEYRWAALTIRKRAKKSRALAESRFAEWRTCELPPPIQLDQIPPGPRGTSGVYIVSSDSQVLYVGESSDIGHRLDTLKTVEAWQHLAPTGIQVVPMQDKLRHGLQSMLVRRLKPLLNSRLLDPSSVGRARCVV
jgi:site-specific DNA-methyltransferase (adenine-specific)